jgi:hypothetical protein
MLVLVSFAIEACGSKSRLVSRDAAADGATGGNDGLTMEIEPTDGAHDTSAEELAAGPPRDGPDAADDAVMRDGMVGADLPPPDLPPSDLPPSDLPPSDLPPSDLPPSDLGSGEAGAGACGTAGGACTGLTGCSSGDDVDIACRSILLCQSGTLRAYTPIYLRCGATSGSPCPATQPVAGAACSLQGQTCSYPTGTCSCATGCEGGADAGPCQRPKTWYCGSPLAGCPTQAPQLGASCSNEKATCSYGSYCYEYQVSCQGGYWEPATYLSFGGCA